MPIADLTTFEFKCQKCAQPQQATPADSGSIASCQNCGKSCIVPEPNSDWDSAGNDAEPNSDGGSSYESYKAAMLNEELAQPSPYSEQQFREELYSSLGDVEDMSLVASSRAKRFLGSIIDSALMGISVLIGMIVFGVLSSAGILKLDQHNPSTLDMINAVCVIYFPLFAFALFQWNLTATEGKTVAKKLLRMKIVTRDGSSPGFARGVAIRYWVVAALGFVPFFSLLNLLFIFGEQKRCIHDYLAGTYVVDA